MRRKQPVEKVAGFVLSGVMALGCSKPAETAPAAPPPAARPGPAVAPAPGTPPADAGRPVRQPGDPVPPGERPPNLLTPEASPGPLQRPPHPTMATSAHGLAAINALVAQVPAATQALTLETALAELGSAEDGSELRARDLFVQLYRVATSDAGRADAVGGVMLSLVLAPDPQGYTERLTDAYGMSLYVVALNSGTARMPEAARVVVTAAAGRIRESMEIAGRLVHVEAKDAWLRLGEGIARSMLGQRGAALDALDASAANGKAPARTYLERARVHLALGEAAPALKDAQTALKMSPRCNACRVAEARAMASLPGSAAAGVTALGALAGGGLPEPLKVEALTAAALAEAVAGHGPAVESLAAALRPLKTWGPEAALVTGLAASVAGDHPGAILALDKATRDLPTGQARSAGLWALARSASAEKNHGRALEALTALEQDAGPAPEIAELAATILAAMGDKEGAAQEILKAHALDPYSAQRAAAAGRKPRAGGAANSERMAQVWRLLGGGVPRAAMVVLDTLDRADRNNPTVGWGRVVAQRQLDALLPVGTAPGNEAAQFAADAISACGREVPSAVLPPPARRVIANTLDEGARGITRPALERMLASEKDPGLLKLLTEAVARTAPRTPEHLHK